MASVFRRVISHQSGLSRPALHKLRHLLTTHRQQCLGQELRRLLEAAEKTVSRSLLCMGFVVSQSVTAVERFVCFAGQSVLWRECAVVFVILILKINNNNNNDNND